MSIISIRNLNFAYKKNEPILKNLSMEIHAGNIYGFLGSNGAGKSTTIRNLLGLLKPQSGEINLFDKDIKQSKMHILKRIGCLIEAPSIYPHLNAVDNLKLICNYRGISWNTIDSVLDKVNLLQDRKKTTRKYSTGMKQRLGLAMALIHDPELLILDEPTNGLDPSGITEIRNIIIRLKEEGKTIMLSSHLLSEIEKMATQVGLIKNGELIFQGSLDELGDLESSNQNLELFSSNSAKARLLLAEYEVVSEDMNCLQIRIKSKKEVPSIIRKIAASDVDLYEVKFLKSNLEKMFISMTNEDKS